MTHVLMIRILNMSLNACWLIAAILLLRKLLKKTDRGLFCALWLVTGVRLLVPFSFPSIFSLIPNAKVIPETIEFSPSPAIDSGISSIDTPVNNVLGKFLTPNPIASVNPMQIVMHIIWIVWIAGMLAIAVYALYGMYRLRRSTSASVRRTEQIYVCDDIEAPFVFGLFHPAVYIPSGMNKDVENAVLKHECMHLKFHDSIWKLVGYCVLIVHWFNPLAWLGYIRFCEDLEYACDERIIRLMSKEERACYSEAMLNFGKVKRSFLYSPVYFGEVQVKKRIERVLTYKQPALWKAVLAAVFCFLIAGCFTFDPIKDSTYTELNSVPFGTFLIDQNDRVYFPVDVYPAEIKGKIDGTTDSGTAVYSVGKDGWLCMDTEDGALVYRSADSSTEGTGFEDLVIGGRNCDSVETYRHAALSLTYSARHESLMKAGEEAAEKRLKNMSETELTAFLGEAHQKAEFSDETLLLFENSEGMILISVKDDKTDTVTLNYPEVTALEDTDLQVLWELVPLGENEYVAALHFLSDTYYSFENHSEFWDSMTALYSSDPEEYFDDETDLLSLCAINGRGAHMVERCRIAPENVSAAEDLFNSFEFVIHLREHPGSVTMKDCIVRCHAKPVK